MHLHSGPAPLRSWQRSLGSHWGSLASPRTSRTRGRDLTGQSRTTITAVMLPHLAGCPKACVRLHEWRTHAYHRQDYGSAGVGKLQRFCRAVSSLSYHAGTVCNHGAGASPNPWLPLTRLWPSVPHGSPDQSLTGESPTHRERRGGPRNSHGKRGSASLGSPWNTVTRGFRHRHALSTCARVASRIMCRTRPRNATFCMSVHLCGGKPVHMSVAVEVHKAPLC